MKTPATTKVMTSALGSLNYDPPIRFTPRQKRAIDRLIQGPVMRKQLDACAGVSNSPMLVSQLRDKGLSIDCYQVRRIDRDGRICWPGRYFLTYCGRQTLEEWGCLP